MPYVYEFPPAPLPPSVAAAAGSAASRGQVTPTKTPTTYSAHRTHLPRRDSSAFQISDGPVALHGTTALKTDLRKMPGGSAPVGEIMPTQNSSSSSSLSPPPPGPSQSPSPKKRYSKGREDGFFAQQALQNTLAVEENEKDGRYERANGTQAGGEAAGAAADRDGGVAGEDGGDGDGDGDEQAMDLDEVEEGDENRPPVPASAAASETKRSRTTMTKSWSGHSLNGTSAGRSMNGHTRTGPRISTNGHPARQQLQAQTPADVELDTEEQWSEDEEDGGTRRVVLHVEVCRYPTSPSQPTTQSSLLGIIKSLLQQEESLQTGTLYDHNQSEHRVLRANIRRVWIAESEPPLDQVDPTLADLQLHFYTHSDQDEVSTFTAVAEEDDEADAVPAASVRELPCVALEGIWENLIYTSDLKPRLLRYIRSTMAFSQAEVDFNKVSWNRLLLLHGPPGTGKTSLCRGLAQKLLVRMGDAYDEGKLVEINSHSLFSKWFSESGKLVQKLFSAVTEMVENPRCLVIVMIDEVESLTAARSAAINGSEPSDALRVVNALLTQLDKLKTRPNVLVMTTSNIPDTIDSAFIDRADEKFFVDYPPPQAVYTILKGCLEELRDKGMMLRCKIQPAVVAMRADADRRRSDEARDDLEETDPAMKGASAVNGRQKRVRLRGEEREKAVAGRLVDLAKKCHKAHLAGRFLRRLPLLAHSRKLSAAFDPDGASGPGRARSIETWLDAFVDVVREEIQDRERVARRTTTRMADVTPGEDDQY